MVEQYRVLPSFTEFFWLLLFLHWFRRRVRTFQRAAAVFFSLFSFFFLVANSPIGGL